MLFCFCPASFLTFGKFSCRSPREGIGGSRCQIRSFFRRGAGIRIWKCHRHKGDDGQKWPIFEYGVQTREKWVDKNGAKLQHGVRSNFFYKKTQKTQKDSGEERSHSKIESDDEFGFSMQRKESWRAWFSYRKRGGNLMWKSIYFWARGLSSIFERWDLLSTFIHPVVQSGMTKNGLLKSGSIVMEVRTERICWWTITRLGLISMNKLSTLENVAEMITKHVPWGVLDKLAGMMCYSFTVEENAKF